MVFETGEEFGGRERGRAKFADDHPAGVVGDFGSLDRRGASAEGQRVKRNGRVARALMAGLLARHGLITLPCLPLNSVFETRKSAIASAFRTAIERGAQHLLQALLCAAVNEAAALACRAQSAEAAAHSGGLLHLSDRQIPPHQD